MKNLNIEIKARCSKKTEIREILLQNGARFLGTDKQTDTYFNCRNGRLKFREGNIEYSLVSYQRENKTTPKKSDVIYYHPRKNTPLKEILNTALGKLIIVKKTREIYFIDNIKFHLDRVENLGDFVEIEAIDHDGKIDETTLLEQCNKYLTLLGISSKDLIECSYSDLLLAQSEK
ncbi:MAG: adenylate cyclase [Candidatus Cloacimonas sp. SDB]|nr:MAG: adenylate cyclase [Candidatus Cloacimonas sp. SDB]